MNHNWSTERIIAVTRIACTLATSIAAGFGLALDADALFTGCASLLAFVCYVWSWWSNNNISKAAQEAQKYLDRIKALDRHRDVSKSSENDQEPKTGDSGTFAKETSDEATEAGDNGNRA